jgi:hypothetical protein
MGVAIAVDLPGTAQSVPTARTLQILHNAVSALTIVLSMGSAPSAQEQRQQPNARIAQTTHSITKIAANAQH